MDLKRYISKLPPDKLPALALTLLIIAAGAIMTALAYADSAAVSEIGNITRVFGSRFADSPNGLYLARLLPILASLSIIFLTYVWSSKMLGSWWALLPSALITISPIFLAYGHYFRPEILALLLVFAAAFFFVNTISAGKYIFKKKFYIRTLIYAAMTTLTVFAIARIPAGLETYNSIISILIKIPLPILLLMSVSSVFACINIVKGLNHPWERLRNYLTINESEFLIMIFAAGYCAILLFRPGMAASYIFTPLPIIYILVAASIKNIARMGNYTVAKIALLNALVFLSVVDVLIFYPSYLAYSNKLPVLNDTATLATTSQYDYGSDLKNLAAWLDANRGVSGKIGLDYYGDSDPKDYLGSRYVKWSSSLNAPEAIALDYIGVSAKKLYEARRGLGAGETRNPEDEYLWLKNIYAPYAKIGSIWIYKISL